MNQITHWMDASQIYGSSGVDFINVLRAAFAHVDPKSVRIQSNPQYLFTLLGSTCVKAVPRTLMKLSPDAENQELRESVGGLLKMSRVAGTQLGILPTCTAARSNLISMCSGCSRCFFAGQFSIQTVR